MNEVDRLRAEVARLKAEKYIVETADGRWTSTRDPWGVRWCSKEEAIECDAGFDARPGELKMPRLRST